MQAKLIRLPGVQQLAGQAAVRGNWNFLLKRKNLCDIFLMKEQIKRIIADFHQMPLPDFRRRSLEVPLDLGKIITIVGPRRSGKTFYLFQLMADLMRSFMPAVTKKPRIDKDVVTVTLKVQRRNVEKLRRYARCLESDEERNYSVAEVFADYIGKEQEIALRSYRTREGLTQVQLARMTGIPQRHISEMENGKRGIGKERARILAKALKVSDYRLLL